MILGLIFLGLGQGTAFVLKVFHSNLTSIVWEKLLWQLHFLAAQLELPLNAQKHDLSYIIHESEESEHLTQTQRGTCMKPHQRSMVMPLSFIYPIHDS